MSASPKATVETCAFLTAGCVCVWQREREKKWQRFWSSVHQQTKQSWPRTNCSNLPLETIFLVSIWSLCFPQVSSSMISTQKNMSFCPRVAPEPVSVMSNSWSHRPIKVIGKQMWRKSPKEKPLSSDMTDTTNTRLAGFRSAGFHQPDGNYNTLWKHSQQSPGGRFPVVWGRKGPQVSLILTFGIRTLFRANSRKSDKSARRPTRNKRKRPFKSRMVHPKTRALISVETTRLVLKTQCQRFRTPTKLPSSNWENVWTFVSFLASEYLQQWIVWRMRLWDGLTMRLCSINAALEILERRFNPLRPVAYTHTHKQCSWEGYWWAVQFISGGGGFPWHNNNLDHNTHMALHPTQHIYTETKKHNGMSTETVESSSSICNSSKSMTNHRSVKTQVFSKVHLFQHKSYLDTQK